MILVTGAGGKTGQAVVRALSSKGEATRALIRRTEQEGLARSVGATETVVADLLDLVETLAAMTGVRTIYLIAPNMHPHETRIGELVIAAAQKSGVERIVYHSVLHPQTSEMPHHWQKLVVEEKLLASGLEYTILQPAAYMQNLLPYWNEIVEENVYRVPYGEDAALSLVDLEDVAEVAAEVLTSRLHVGATYPLAGPAALTPPQIARALSRSLGLGIRCESMSVATWMDQARAGRLRGYALDTLAAMFRYYDRCGLIGSPTVLEWLLGRRPTTLGEFVDRTIAAEDKDLPAISDGPAFP